MFTKGQSGNIAGKPKGTLSKLDKSQKEFINTLTEGNRNEFERRWNLLSDKAYCDVYLELMSYIVSKPKNEETNNETNINYEEIIKTIYNARY